jgi:site-specific recombinase XerD
MKKVTLRPLHHRGGEYIGVYFDYDSKIQAALQRTGLVKFSRTQGCWYAPLSRESYERLLQAIKNLAVPDTSAFPVSSTDKKAAKAFFESPEIAPVKKADSHHRVEAGKEVVYKGKNSSAVNSHVVPALHQYLLLKGYSPSTIRTYLGEMAQLLKALGDVPADDLQPEHLKRYLVYCHEKLGLKENTLHSRINAIKFYYEQVLRREKFFWEIPRPKKQILAPRFFNADEITAIIRSAGNIKHKVMLMLGYGTGMRVSEIVRLKVENIDSSRMCILVERAKGKKDRLVQLSPLLLVMLREYWKSAKLPHKGYLFPGQPGDEPYSKRSLQHVLAMAKEKAGVMKPGGVHALRHSFATHLLDKGTDVTLIMKLLGHHSIRTTLRYLHVTNRDLLQVMSPLDDLKL